MGTIAELRTAINNTLDTLAQTYGEDEELNEDEANTVSYEVDEKNETWNPNLPTRPH